jgi:hypothetical protein
MELSNIAQKLNIPLSTIKKESIKDFLERRLLEVKTEFFTLANKYGIKSIREFDRLIKSGKIHETPETREDFFKLDYLENRYKLLKKILKSLKK